MKQEIIKFFIALENLNKKIGKVKIETWESIYDLYWIIYLILCLVISLFAIVLKIAIPFQNIIIKLILLIGVIIFCFKQFFKWRTSLIWSGMLLFVINIIATIAIYGFFNFDENRLSPNQAIIIYAMLWIIVSLFLEKKVAKLINQISVAVFGLIFTIGTYWISVLPEDYIKNFLPINNNEIPFSSAEINRAALQFFLIFLIYIAISTLTEVILNIRDYCVDKYGKDKLNDKE